MRLFYCQARRTFHTLSTQVKREKYNAAWREKSSKDDIHYLRTCLLCVMLHAAEKRREKPMKITRYNDSTAGRVISMYCRRSINNRDVIVIDNTRLEKVFVYDFATIDDVITHLQDTMNIDIVETDQTPLNRKLVNHDSTGYIYQIIHEEDENRDDFHAFFAPVDSE